MRSYKGGVVGKIVIGCIKTKVRISDSGARHVYRIDNLLKKVRREVVVGLDVVNGEGKMGGRKAKRTAYLTKGINKSHDK